MNIYEEAKCIRKNKANYHGTQSHIPLVLNRGFTNIPPADTQTIAFAQHAIVRAD